MKIGGFIKQSLIDYPNKIAAVVFTVGCNFRCGYCHNPYLVLPQLFHYNSFISEDEVITYIKHRKNWLDGIVITGGEPTIHKDLPFFLHKLKKMGYSIKLDSNGSNPLMLEIILKENLVDYIALDIKMPLHDNSLYAKIAGLPIDSMITGKILDSLFLLKKSNIEVEFRTTFIPSLHNDVMIKEIKKLIGEDVKYTINCYREGNNLASFLR